MGILSLILCPAAIGFAAAACVKKNGKWNLCIILSYVCCCMPVIGALFDINDRANHNDIGGILDIYPTMAVVYLILLVMVTAVNCLAIWMRKQTP